MRCTGYCTASSFDIARLFQDSSNLGSGQMVREILYLQYQEGQVFLFPYGVIIAWGLSEEAEKKLLEKVKKYQSGSLPRPEVDDFTFSYGDRLKIEEDQIVLHRKDFTLKLAISYGIAQSVKLSVLEEAIQRTIENSKQLPQNLAVKGKIALSRKETSRKIGQIYLERNYINLQAEILDTPEFFWDRASLEPYYRKMTHYLDINKRADLLNRRLTLLHELFEILANELNHRQSARLEWTIIILIFIEILMAFQRDIWSAG